jgi:amidase
MPSPTGNAQELLGTSSERAGTAAGDATKLSAPSAEELVELARRDDIQLSADEAAELAKVVARLIEAADHALKLDYRLSINRPDGRDPGYQPEADDNRYNAFIRRCRVARTDSGPLAGRTVGVKDNISVAGVPTTNGSRMPAHTPDLDAVVVERILDAGGTIVGKLNMDDMAAAGTGETSAFGPARNPVNPRYSAGGSSGGSGAAVAAGEVDLALAVDQGGSGRIPAAFCGVIAAKATQGLVPSFGVAHIDHTIDSVTPVARTVADTARLLEVIVGADWRDPQWVRGDLVARSYAGTAHDGVAKMRIGIVRESCDERYCVPAVLSGLLRAADALGDAGAEVEETSVPIWTDALAIFQPYIGQLMASMFRSDGEGVGHMGYIDSGRMEAFAQARREYSELLADQIKAWVLADRHLRDRYANVTFGRLHNLRLLVRHEIDAALGRFDLLLTPTLPITAPPLPDQPAPFAEVAERTSAALCYNTAPLNLSGHPALTIPSGRDENGLPTAAQIIARPFQEHTMFRAGFTLEGNLSMSQ